MKPFERRIAALEQALRRLPDTADLTQMGAAGAALLEALGGPKLHDQLGALLGRLDTDTATIADLELLSRLPRCAKTPHQLVQQFVRINDLC